MKIGKPLNVDEMSVQGFKSIFTFNRAPSYLLIVIDIAANLSRERLMAKKMQPNSSSSPSKNNTYETRFFKCYWSVQERFYQ